MTAGNQAVKAASPLRKRLRASAQQPMGAHGSMQAVAADIRPCLDWRHPTSISEKREGGGPHDAGRRLRVVTNSF